VFLQASTASTASLRFQHVDNLLLLFEFMIITLLLLLALQGHGIIGCFRFTDSYYLLVVARREYVGHICGEQQRHEHMHTHALTAQAAAIPTHTHTAQAAAAPTHTHTAQAGFLVSAAII
jgi:hypothetical protein